MIELLDLTSLDDDDDAGVCEALCRRAAEHGTAAVCVMPGLTAVATAALAESPVLVATVANFPEGADDLDGAARATARAAADGADEVDVVAPYRAFLEGDADAVTRLVTACRAETGTLKVILEAGALPDQAAVAEISALALAAGADFIKTSTGKIAQGASPQDARTMLEVIAREGTGGFKAAGGVRTREQAQGYVDLATELLGEGWATPEHFRIGASSLLDALIESA